MNLDGLIEIPKRAQIPSFAQPKLYARVVELEETLELKCNDHCGRVGSSPA